MFLLLCERTWERMRVHESAWESRACWLQQLNISAHCLRDCLNDLLWCNNWNVDDWIDETCFLCCFWFTFYLVEMVSGAGYVSWITSLNHTWVAFECCGYTIFNFSLMALSFLFLFKKLHMCWAMQHPIYFASSWETLCAFFTISVWTKSFFKKYFQFFFLIIFKSNAFLKVFFV